MILDYNYNSNKKNLSISYIKENGAKQVLNFNVERFKSYYRTPTGKYTNWDGSKCDIRWTERPHLFDLKTYITELPEQYKKLLRGKTAPKLYTFDIETRTKNDGDKEETFPEPSEAKFPITTISIVSPECNAMILGTRPLGPGGDALLQSRFEEYINKLEYFSELGLPMPKIKYVCFPSEESMLRYFLEKIVAVVPVLAGWNSILFDWQYIQNRCKFYYPNLYFGSCSCIKSLTSKNYTNQKQEKVRLSMPNHTLILDMMDVIENFDMVVMPIKEAMGLDFVASETIHAHKIEYDGSLEYLYQTDYDRYVFYNGIDSLLVQLLDKKFKTMQNIYTQALYCDEMIGKCFSKIALSEALFFNYFYQNGIKVVPEEKNPDRGRLLGAYVRKPLPGKWKYICCNDFAALYPSSIRTTNIGPENYVDAFWKDDILNPYRSDLQKYIVIGPNVFENKGTLEKPELGKFIGKYLDDEKLEKYRKDPNYFVSVNGCVYKNDKDYAFRIIQTELAMNRNKSKYLYKKMDATVMADVKHLLDGKNIKDRNYEDDVVEGVKEIGYTVVNTSDIRQMMSDGSLKEFSIKLEDEITYLSSFEQACKLLANSLYGGSSHVAFFWFNMNLANDITGEARNIIHKMEHHIPDFLAKNWPSLTDLHKKLGIHVDPTRAARVLENSIDVTKEMNPDSAYHGKSFATIVYGDTDSLYISYDSLVKSIDGSDKWDIAKTRDFIAKFALEFMNDHNREFMEQYYATRFGKSVQNFELETIALSGCWLDVKKRYAQILLWKDGKVFDIDDLPLKIKGLEMVKSSVPRQAREGLKRMVRYLLEDNEEDYVTQRLNIKMQEEKKKYFDADLEDICASMGINGYTKYIADDADPSGLKVNPKCPVGPKALGNYNWLRQRYGLPGEPMYGGSKFKIYMFRPKGSNPRNDIQYFAFQRGKYPKWADQYAPVSREEMFRQYMIDPFNRILEAIGYQKLNPDGSIQMNLFDF